MVFTEVSIGGNKFHGDPLLQEVTSLGPLSLSNMGLGGFDLDFSRFGMPQRKMMPLQISETNDMYKVRAELPGIGSKNDIELKMDRGSNGNYHILSIKAEKRKESEITKDQEVYYHREEFSHGVCTRKIRLPDYIDMNITPSATFENGVLSVHLKKIAENKQMQAINIPIS